MSDDELMAAINGQADKAEEAAPKEQDTLALATVLAQKFDHRTVEEIEEKIKDVWRSRGLFWRS